MQEKTTQNNEQVFDIEEFIKKAKGFNKEKNKLEKLKTDGYLNSLCPTLKDKICFRAVYDELFPNDFQVSDMLRKVILEMLNTDIEDSELLSEYSLNDIDLLYRKFRIFAKSTIKKLQQVEIMQIERMRRRARQKAFDDKIRRLRENIPKNKRKIIEEEKQNDLQINQRSIQGEKLNSQEKFSGILSLGGLLNSDILHVKPNNQTYNRFFKENISQQMEWSKKQKLFYEPSPEIKEALKHDRQHAREREKRLKEMVKNHRLDEKIRLQSKQRALKKEITPPQMHK